MSLMIELKSEIKKSRVCRIELDKLRKPCRKREGRINKGLKK